MTRGMLWAALLVSGVALASEHGAEAVAGGHGEAHAEGHGSSHHQPTPPPAPSAAKVRACCEGKGGTYGAGNTCDVKDAALVSAIKDCVTESDENVAEYIFHHVGDSNELVFEVPLSYWVFDQMAPWATLRVAGAAEPVKVFPQVGRDIVIPLPHWTVELKPNGCALDEHGHVPSLPGCLDLSVTKTAVMMWVAAVLLVALVLVFSHRSREQLVPRGHAANIIEALVLFVRDELAVKNIGKEEARHFTPYLLTIFFFILTMNLLGLLPWMATATGNLAVTCGLALFTFVLTQLAAIRSAGLGGYLAHLTGGVHWLLWPIMIPVEVLGLFTKPFALTVRLFANMLAGHVVLFFLMSLVFLLKAIGLAPVGVAFAFAIYLLELFVAFLQAYVFTMLSALFIGMGVAMGHHHHDDHGHAAH